ncbi:hypothetical protein TCSYLVIO_001911 [Trypanosoma cruzi]|uniref:Peripherally associated n=2 Tax=Trypanosoma cruzi TaxID=5693 RepID=V5B816_TRYCR|nr:hypothetical protein TCSYLVIO_001911 [Trypanosoma cruzi]ESS69400.1 hypothetical protein TCDM_01924 [Trypanosoma cruzi Dm28c]PBJ71719.1 hypothetical protein BCY84_16394 [Trypanosoma cruzi cruzi]KAF8281082.1 peripherally associated ATOM36 [Trypanosoma cruzi]PBJ79917.1 hypothetical protein BCY84_02171 [Trypanosoma cruzi cruzi]
MTEVASVPALGGRDYFFAPKGRVFPNHGFTSRSIVYKRFAENTTPLALSVGLVLPTMVDIQMKLDECVAEGVDMPLSKVLGIVKEAGKVKFLIFADAVSRVAVQTGFACLLIHSNTAYGNSVVFLWDMYPKMHQIHVADLVKFLRLPPFFSRLFGPLPTQSELRVYNMPISPLAAAEDCMKRSTLQLLSDVVVDAVECCVMRKLVRSSSKGSGGFLKRSAVHVTLGVLKVCGSAVGRAVAGARGEYWGEIVGIAVAPVAFAQFSVVMHVTRRRHSRGVKPSERTRSSSGGRSKESGAQRGNVRRTPLEKKA